MAAVLAVSASSVALVAAVLAVATKFNLSAALAATSAATSVYKASA